jgi:hypothetical protein
VPFGAREESKMVYKKVYDKPPRRKEDEYCSRGKIQCIPSGLRTLLDEKKEIDLLKQNKNLKWIEEDNSTYFWKNEGIGKKPSFYKYFYYGPTY